MAGRIYTPEFRADAVALWRASAGQRAMKDVAADLGITRETLRVWVRAAEGGGQASAGWFGAVGIRRCGGGPVACGERPAAEGGEGVAAGAGDPASGGPVFCQGDEVTSRRWDFISAHAGEFGVQRLCRVLRVSRSGYYRWLAGADARSARQAADDALVAKIREIHTESGEAYGVLRVHADLQGFGHHVNRKRVARLMRAHGIVGRHLRRKKKTTVPDTVAPPAPDLLQRDFTASRLDERWCGDLTYIQVGGRWLFLACVIDICSRRVLGWSMAPHMRAELVIDALRMAVSARGRDVAGVVFHSDRGSQYTSAAFAQVCDGYGVRRSMGRVGSSYDNALAESLIREAMYKTTFPTMSQARLGIFRWLTYYNARRRHSALAYLSPMEFEQQHHTTAKLSLAA